MNSLCSGPHRVFKRKVIEREEEKIMNNFYPTYSNYPQGYNAVPVQSARQGIIWVNGEEGARAYAMAPNSNVMLLDAENEGRFYIKSADNIGMSSLRIFEYKEILDAQPVSQMHTQTQYHNGPVEYATKQELQELKDMINSLSLQARGGGRNEQSVQPAQYRANKNVSGPNNPRE